MRAPVIALSVLLGAAPVGAQILSPGDLGASHAELEGLSNCTRCHVLGEKIDGELCLECHRPVALAISKKQGFHGRGAAANRPCLDCHRDHRGRDAPLTEWRGPREKFAHAGTGFPLEGAHAGLRCDRCHRADWVKDSDLVARLRARPESTYLGLEGRCGACHSDPHRGQLGERCQRCHDTRAFRPAPGFDHGATFALVGAHARIACGACHPTTAPATPELAALVQYDGVERACHQCHRDVHGGKFGQRCDRCHGQESWARTRLDRTDVTFHDRTRFPLRGKHRAAPCARCHPPKLGGGLVTRDLRFGACQDCHLDAHLGQMTPDADGRVPCQRCHDERGFFPSRYPVADHQKGPYPLEGAHRVVACNACHPPDPEGLRARVPPEARDLPEPVPGNRLINFTRIRRPELDLARCSSCHRDPHEGQFAAAPRPRACRDCHRVSDFSTVDLDHDRDTDYPLTGAHRRAACVDCHPRPADGAGVTAWRGAPQACAACHRDAHLGQFGAEGCEGCHATEAFAPSSFDHADPEREVFRLTGKHQGLPCARCHPSVTGEDGARRVWYRGIPARCDGCHVDVHAGSTTGGAP